MEELKLFATYMVYCENEEAFYLMLTGFNETTIRGVITYGKNPDDVIGRHALETPMKF